jgi:hypothetical protein
MYTSKNETSPLNLTLYKNEFKLLVLVHLDTFQNIGDCEIKVDVQMLFLYVDLHDFGSMPQSHYVELF